MARKKVLSMGCVLALLMFSACTYYRTEEVIPCSNLPSGRSVSYMVDVAPIIQTTCAIAHCHVNGFENGDFTNFSALKAKADSGKLELMITTGV